MRQECGPFRLMGRSADTSVRMFKQEIEDDILSLSAS